VDYVLPVSFAVAIWWLSTVVLIYRTGMPRASYPATLGAATIVALAGIWAIVASRSAVTDAAMYAGFAGAIAVWGWHEVTYLFGFVSGPRPAACPPSCTGWRRFAFGLRACAYHEFLVVATAGVLTLLTWGHPNRISLWAFVILWLMRWSAKLNIFLGVRNLHSEYWPEHLAYLKSFTRQRAMNPLFPLSMVGAVAGLWLLGSLAQASGEESAVRTGSMLLLSLLALAALEHVFLVLRIPDGVLWSPGLRSRRALGRPVPAKLQQRL
jgi:putative photosynthetic complex assembly protein 2